MSVYYITFWGILVREEVMNLKKKLKFLNAFLAVGLLVSPTTVLAKDIGWGIPKKAAGEDQPFPGAEYDEIVRQNDAYYIGTADDNAVYLTFDCGYENGNLPMILDALRDHGVSALFFLTGHFMEEEPELVLRMVNEGHLVGNHTYDHPNLTTVSQERFISEMTRAEEKFTEITGEQMAKYLRPPEGKFNQEMLDWAADAGYYTILWSLAYVDWYVDKQQGADHALTQVMNRIHPGAIILLHSTSSDNAEAMDQLLPAIKGAGYEFKTLDDLVGQDVLAEEIEISL